jgi:hypothetical protein
MQGKIVLQKNKQTKEVQFPVTVEDAVLLNDGSKLSSGFNEVKATTNSFNQRMETVEASIQEHNEKIETSQTDIGTLQTDMGTLQSALNTEVDTLNTEIDNTQQQINSLATELQNTKDELFNTTYTSLLTTNQYLTQVEDNIVDGGFKHALLKGKTLINLFACEDYVHKSRADYPCQINNEKITVDNLIPNRTYTVYYWHHDNNLTWALNCRNSETQQAIIDWTNINTPVAFTTPEDYQGIIPYLKHKRGDIELDFTRFVILEGDVTETIPFYSMELLKGIQSVERPFIATTKENLFNPNYISDYYIDGYGNFDKGATTFCTRWMECKPNTTYVCRNTTRNRWMVLNSDGSVTCVGGEVGNETPTVTTGENATHLKLYYYAHEYAENRTRNAMIVEEASDIKGDFSNIIQPNLQIALRSLRDGTCDTYNPITGEYIQRVGYLHYNQSTSFELVYADGYKIIMKTPFAQDGDFANIYDTSRQYAYLTRGTPMFTVGWDVEGWDNPRANIGINTVNQQGFVELIIKTSFLADETAFREWMKTNTITIQYALKTPVVKYIHGGIPQITKGGKIQVGSSLTPVIPELEYQLPTNTASKLEQLQNSVNDLVRHSNNLMEDGMFTPYELNNSVRFAAWGHYVRVGNMVTCYMSIQCTHVMNSMEIFTISGLPYKPARGVTFSYLVERIGNGLDGAIPCDGYMTNLGYLYPKAYKPSTGETFNLYTSLISTNENFLTTFSINFTYQIEY